ncbi:MAG: hypothetical protein ACFHVJ_09820 [Aestuariibacter sp.]
MVSDKYERQLKILIVDQNITARSKLKTMLGTKGQSQVDLMRDGRDLVGRELAFKYDLIFVREDLDYSLGGADLVRYLTRTNLVPRWSKFVLLAENAEEICSTPIFRHLRTEIWETPINYQMVANVVSSTIQSLDVFQDMLKNLNHIPASLIISKMSELNIKEFDDIHRDELLELKIKLLLQGRRPDLAWDVSERINYPADKYREQLFITSSTGQKERYQETMEEALLEGVLDKGCTYYQTYHAVMEGEIEQALQHFKSLTENALHPNEMETEALLMLKAQGLKKAIEYIESKLDIRSEGYDLRNILSLTQLKCYSLALLTGDCGGQSSSSINNAMVDLIANNTWGKGSFQYNIYKPFILLGTALLQGKEVNASFEKLYMYRHQLDVTQLNILLFVSQKLKREEQSWEIQKILDRNVSRMEMCPELISHEIVYKDAMEATLDKQQLADRFKQLAEHHSKSGRLYRALKKYYICHKRYGLDNASRLKMAKIMKALHLQQYWSIGLEDLEDASVPPDNELKEIA